MAFDRCTRCILPATFPGLTFDEAGVCQHCKDAEVAVDFEKVRAEVEAFIRERLDTSSSYDIALAFSGGKDSTYALKYLKDTFGCRIVAITIDNDFISDCAYDNCRKMPAQLGVDHIFIKPNPRAMHEIYSKSISQSLHPKAALMRASAICSSCIQVINTQIVNFASNYGVPIVAGGYIGGQIPSQTGFMKQNLEVTVSLRRPFMDRLQTALDTESLRLFTLQPGAQKEIAVINPMIYLNRSEEQIIAEIGLLGWRKPNDTGKSSTNCLLNDYAIYVHEKKHQYHPYVFEIATMVRRGTMSRDEALRKTTNDFREQDFTAVRQKLVTV